MCNGWLRRAVGIHPHLAIAVLEPDERNYLRSATGAEQAPAEAVGGTATHAKQENAPSGFLCLARSKAASSSSAIS